MTDTNSGIQTALQDSVPPELVSQIETMRRNPTDFYFRRRSSCSLGCDRKGERTAYQIGHKDVEEAGTWCPTHGWLSFESALILPTERLSPSEIEDRKIEQRRKAEFAQRKARQ